MHCEAEFAEHAARTARHHILAIASPTNLTISSMSREPSSRSSIHGEFFERFGCTVESGG
jgi:hypothetical protein